MKTRIPSAFPRFIATGMVAIAAFASVGQITGAAQPATDPKHAAHVASGAMPPDVATADPALSQQISALQAKVVQLEAALAQGTPPTAGGAAMPGMAAAPPSASPSMGMGMDQMKSGAAMQSMSAVTTPPPAMPGMNTPAAPAAGMMGMMSQMMGMMDKMMSMGGTNTPMPPAPAGGSSGGGGMAMDQMEMAGMMGMGPMGGTAASASPQSALPGFPGASHLYHIGATGFFLDHSQHLTLTIEQQAGLNKAKEQAALAKSTADRAAEQAEQALWALTAADQPDAAKIEAKILEIEKLRGDERLSFIRAVGDASKILTDEQRKILTGFAPTAPVAAAMPVAMKGM